MLYFLRLSCSPVSFKSIQLSVQSLKDGSGAAISNFREQSVAIGRNASYEELIIRSANLWIRAR